MIKDNCDRDSMHKWLCVESYELIAFAHQPFFLANRLFNKLRTFVTLNCTYSRSRSS
jgi:hypothetical protein